MCRSRAYTTPHHTTPRHTTRQPASHPVPPSSLPSPPSPPSSIPHPNESGGNPPRITLPVVIRLASHSRQQIPSPSATHCHHHHHHHCHFASSALPPAVPSRSESSERSVHRSFPRALRTLSLSLSARASDTVENSSHIVTQPAVHSLVNHPRHPEHREMRGPGLVHGPPHVDGKIFHGYFRLSRGASERIPRFLPLPLPLSPDLRSGSTGIPRIQRSPAPAPGTRSGDRRRMIFVSRCQMLYTSESGARGWPGFLFLFFLFCFRICDRLGGI